MHADLWFRLFSLFLILEMKRIFKIGVQILHICHWIKFNCTWLSCVFHAEYKWNLFSETGSVYSIYPSALKFDEKWWKTLKINKNEQRKILWIIIRHNVINELLRRLIYWDIIEKWYTVCWWLYKAKLYTANVIWLFK